MPDPAAWLIERLGELSHFDPVGPTTDTIWPPEVTAMHTVRKPINVGKIMHDAEHRPSPPAYSEGHVPLVVGGYGDLLGLFPGMKPVNFVAVGNVLSITRNHGAPLVVTARETNDCVLQLTASP